MNAGIDVLIPCRNRVSELKKTVNDLRKQSKTPGKIILIGSRREINAISGKNIIHVEETAPKGKARAILEGKKKVTANIVILSSADLRIPKHALESIHRAFSDKSIGIVTVRPAPIPSRSLRNRVETLLWAIHHRISLNRPKAGELIGIRTHLLELSPDSLADEEELARHSDERGFRRKYIPAIIVRNQPVKTWSGFCRQRIRIARGHDELQRTNTKVPTRNLSLLVPAIRTILKKDTLLPLILLASIEFSCRLTGKLLNKVERPKGTWNPEPLS